MNYENFKNYAIIAGGVAGGVAATCLFACKNH